MARIQFDKTNGRYIESGVSKGILFPKGKKGVVWNGLTSVSESSSGAETVDLWADNMKYASFRSIENYEATIEAYTYPEEFSECDGSAKFAKGAYIGQQTRLPFDFCYRTEVLDGNGNARNDGYKIHLIYNATASPSEKSYETINDSPDGVSLSWEISAQPFVLRGRRASSCIVIDSTKADRFKVQELEKILYGLGDGDPRMPDPDEVVDLIKRLDVSRVFVDTLSKSGNWVWDTFNFQTDSIPIAIENEAYRHIYYDPEAGTTYIQPSIAYMLVSEADEVRHYIVIVIDTHSPSELSEDLRAQLHMNAPTVTKHGDFYYYSYNLYI